jgi:hypothetical protein
MPTLELLSTIACLGSCSKGRLALFQCAERDRPPLIPLFLVSYHRLEKSQFSVPKVMEERGLQLAILELLIQGKPQVGLGWHGYV